MEPLSYDQLREHVSQMQSMGMERGAIERILSETGVPSNLIKRVFEELATTFSTATSAATALTHSVSSSLGAKAASQAAAIDQVVQEFQLLESEQQIEQFHLLEPEQQIEHLFLTEMNDYIRNFIWMANEKIGEDLRLTDEERSMLAERMQNFHIQITEQLIQIWGKDNFAQWQQGIPKSEAEKLWSTSEEKKRQAQTKSLIEGALYDVLALAEQYGINGDQLANFHRDICGAVAELKKERVLVGGKVEIAQDFQVETDRKEILKAAITTKQFTDNIQDMHSSMDKRTKPKPVNIHTEQATFISPDGSQVTVTQLRSGSFDMDRAFNEKELDSALKKSTFTQQEISKMQRDFLNALRAGTEETFSESIFSSGNSNRIALLYKAIENMSDKDLQNTKGNWLKKLETEYKERKKHELIIEQNRKVIEQVMTKVDRDQIELGYKMPESVRSILQPMGWGMISLQTPANLKPEGGGLIHAIASKFADPEVNELYPIYRELMGYLQANGCKTFEEFVERCQKGEFPDFFYFNLPTNIAGATRRYGPLSIKPAEYLVSGAVDKTYAAQIAQVTDLSVRNLYHRSQQAVEALIQAAAAAKDVQTKRELDAHAKMIQEMMEDTFLIEEDKVSLKGGPSNDALYEIPARVNVLMQLIGCKTTGHCRSGNNRTFYWLAKSHQLVADMAAPSRVRLATPKQTAGVAAGEEEHWSAKVFDSARANSLALQQMNKGTRGTKVKMAEFRSDTYQEAVIRGAFRIAGAFDKDKMKKAREKRLEILFQASITMPDKVRDAIQLGESLVASRRLHPNAYQEGLKLMLKDIAEQFENGLKMIRNSEQAQTMLEQALFLLTLPFNEKIKKKLLLQLDHALTKFDNVPQLTKLRSFIKPFDKWLSRAAALENVSHLDDSVVIFFEDAIKLIDANPTLGPLIINRVNQMKQRLARKLIGAETNALKRYFTQICRFYDFKISYSDLDNAPNNRKKLLLDNLYRPFKIILQLLRFEHTPEGYKPIQ